jgi:glyoxalase superfamily protein
MTERNRDEFKVSDRGGEGASLYFMQVPEPKVIKNRLHLDLITDGSMEEEVARLPELGARVIEVRHDPEELQSPDTWTVMQDPEGNEFCVSSWATVTNWN